GVEEFFLGRLPGVGVARQPRANFFCPVGASQSARSRQFAQFVSRITPPSPTRRCRPWLGEPATPRSIGFLPARVRHRTIRRFPVDPINDGLLEFRSYLRIPKDFHHASQGKIGHSELFRCRRHYEDLSKMPEIRAGRFVVTSRRFTL